MNKELANKVFDQFKVSNEIRKSVFGAEDEDYKDVEITEDFDFDKSLLGVYENLEGFTKEKLKSDFEKEKTEYAKTYANEQFPAWMNPVRNKAAAILGVEVDEDFKKLKASELLERINTTRLDEINVLKDSTKVSDDSKALQDKIEAFKATNAEWTNKYAELEAKFEVFQTETETKANNRVNDYISKDLLQKDYLDVLPEFDRDDMFYMSNFKERMIEEGIKGVVEIDEKTGKEILVPKKISDNTSVYTKAGNDIIGSFKTLFKNWGEEMKITKKSRKVDDKGNPVTTTTGKSYGQLEKLRALAEA